MEALERLEGHYDAQEVPFGTVYRWCPECLVVECKCGKRLTLKRANLTDSWTAVCECGEDRIDDDQEEEVVVGVGGLVTVEADRARHPWRYAWAREGLGLPV